MNRELINKYIAMPMAIKVFIQDIEKFNEFKLGNLYVDMLDSIIQRMHQDYFDLKAELISIHHVDVKKLDVGKYKINNEVVEFTPEELKKFTEEVMSDYLYGEKASSFERKERTWND
jgi:hypothetical protein